MMCPRCGNENEWDVSKTPCERCGLLVHLPRRSGTRPNPTPMGGARQGAQNLRPAISPQSGGMPSIKQQSDGMSPLRQASNKQPFPATYTSGYSTNQTPFSNTRESIERSQPSLPIQTRQAQNERSLPSPENTLPDTPRPMHSSLPSYESNPLMTNLQKEKSQMGHGLPQIDNMPRRENAALRSVPHRPQTQVPFNRSTDQLIPDMQRSIRPSRLVTDRLNRQATRPSHSTDASNVAEIVPNYSDKAVPIQVHSLTPGTLLRGGRYRLRELQDRQDWLDGVFEAMWVAQDAQRSGSQVMICELVTPDSKSMVMQSTLRNATMALTSVGRHQHIPTLWDAFSDQDRNFFVFEPVEGESLMARMRRTGRALPEQDVVECCLQMTEVLELLAQQAPPLVHGLIRPEHIAISRFGSDYILTNFSIILAGGATQFIAGIDRARLSPYASPEFSRGMVDTRSDLYALLATAYHAVTGSAPTSTGVGIPQARRLNPTISPEFDAILSRGLHPLMNQRYQRPSELRQDLLSMRSVNGTLANRSGSLAEPSRRAEHPVPVQPSSPQKVSANDTVSQILPGMLAPAVEDQDRKLLLPRPEELPPMPVRNDAQQAIFWLVGILVCLVAVIIMSRGLL